MPRPENKDWFPRGYMVSKGHPLTLLTKQEPYSPVSQAFLDVAEREKLSGRLMIEGDSTGELFRKYKEVSADIAENRQSLGDDYQRGLVEAEAAVKKYHAERVSNKDLITKSEIYVRGSLLFAGDVEYLVGCHRQYAGLDTVKKNR